MEQQQQPTSPPSPLPPVNLARDYVSPNHSRGAPSSTSSSSRHSQRTYSQASPPRAQSIANEQSRSPSEKYPKIPQIPIGPYPDADADPHIIDPGLHYNTLRDLEKTILENSIFVRGKGASDLASLDSQGLDARESPHCPQDIAAFISLEESSRTSGTNDGYRPWMRHIIKSFAILSQVRRSFDFLSQHNFCSDSFNILAQLGQSDNSIAQARTIRNSELDVLGDAITEVMRSTGFSAAFDSPPSWSCVDNLSSKCSSFVVGLNLSIGSLDLLDTGDVLILCRALVNLLDVGLTSYVQSHGGRFDQWTFAKSLPSYPLGTEKFPWTVSYRKLACLEPLLQTKGVWVFHDSRASDERYAIAATMKQLSDIWGPAYALRSESKKSSIVQFMVGSGVVRASSTKALADAQKVIECHWSDMNDAKDPLILKTDKALLPMQWQDVLLIGSNKFLRQNDQCRRTVADFERQRRSELKGLGNSPARWEWVQQQLGNQAGSYASENTQGIQKLVPPVTLKQHIWNKWIASPWRANPNILNSYVGVEISYCTGNARRVQLKDLLLHEDVTPHLMRYFPNWGADDWSQGFHAAMRDHSDDALDTFWRRNESYRSKVAETICYVLNLLNATGFMHGQLIAAFLHGQSGRAISIPQGQNDWIRILADSHLTASYAILTSRCLTCVSKATQFVRCSGTANPVGYTVLETNVIVQNGAELSKRVALEEALGEYAVETHHSDNRDETIIVLKEDPKPTVIRLVRNFQSKKSTRIRELLNGMEVATIPRVVYFQSTRKKAH